MVHYRCQLFNNSTQHSYSIHMTTSSSTTQVLQTMSGQLSTTVNGAGLSGSFGVQPDQGVLGNGVLFSGMLTNFVLPQFTSSNATLYFHSGNQPKNPTIFKAYIDTQGVQIYSNDGSLITAIFDTAIVLNAEGYELQGTATWIGVVVGQGSSVH